MEHSDYATTIIQLLDEIHHLYHKKYREVVQELHITEEQFRVLRFLANKNRRGVQEFSVGYLAEKFKVAPNTMSERLTRLEEKGLILRERSRDDRRRYIVELSEEGISLLVHTRSEHKRQFILDIQNGLERKKAEQLAGLLSELASRMKEE